MIQYALSIESFLILLVFFLIFLFHWHKQVTRKREKHQHTWVMSYLKALASQSPLPAAPEFFSPHILLDLLEKLNRKIKGAYWEETKKACVMHHLIPSCPGWAKKWHVHQRIEALFTLPLESKNINPLPLLAKEHSLKERAVLLERTRPIFWGNVLPIIESDLKAECPLHRIKAVRALLAFPTKRTIPIILSHIKDPSLPLKWLVLEALPWLMKEDAIFFLEKFLFASHQHTRLLAAMALRRLGTSGIESLKKHKTPETTYALAHPFYDHT